MFASMSRLWKVVVPFIFLVPLVLWQASGPTTFTQTFAKPIDALSIHMTSAAPVDVRAKTGSGWTAWETLTIDNEQDPALAESNLVLFPVSVNEVEFSNAVALADVHPIRVSDAPVHY